MAGAELVPLARELLDALGEPARLGRARRLPPSQPGPASESGTSPSTRSPTCVNASSTSRRSCGTPRTTCWTTGSRREDRIAAFVAAGLNEWRIRAWTVVRGIPPPRFASHIKGSSTADCARRRERAHVPLRRNRDFVLLQLGQLLSSFGSSLSTIAYPLLTLAVTPSPAKAGYVSAMLFAPMLVSASLPDWRRIVSTGATHDRL